MSFMKSECSFTLSKKYVLYIQMHIIHICLYIVYIIYCILCIIYHKLQKLPVKIPVYPKLDGVAYIVLWYVGWSLLKRMQSGNAQLCEHEKCLHPFWINVLIALNKCNLDLLHLLKEGLSSFFFFFYCQSFSLHVISLKFLVTMAEKKINPCMRTDWWV